MGMMCEGGCVGGPSRHKNEQFFKKDRDKLIQAADARGVHENLDKFDASKVGMHK